MRSHPKLQELARKRLPLVVTVFILIQPLLDILTSFGAKAGQAVTVGVIVRTLFMGLCFLYFVFISQFENKKKFLIYLGALMGYLVLFMLYMLVLGGFSLCLSNAKESVKVIFAPVVFLALYAMYRQYGYRVPMWALAVSGGVYAAVILIAFLTKTSNVSYGNSGYGYNGWFYAANETSTIIALTAPVVICFCLSRPSVFSRRRLWVAALIAVTLASISFSANYIGTKIVFLVIALYCVAATVWLLIRFIRTRKAADALLVAVMAVMCFSLFGSYIISAVNSLIGSSAGSSAGSPLAPPPLKQYFDDIYAPLIGDELEERLKVWGADVWAASDGTWIRVLMDKYPSFKRLDQILSRRLFTAASSVQIYTEGGIAAKLLGIGYANAPSYDRNIEYMIEMDPLGMLIRHGVAGFLLIIVPYAAVIVHFIKKFFSSTLKRLSDLTYCSLLFSALLAFAISLVAGHVLVSPGVSIYVIVIVLALGGLIREQDKQFRLAGEH